MFNNRLCRPRLTAPERMLPTTTKSALTFFAVSLIAVMTLPDILRSFTEFPNKSRASSSHSMTPVFVLHFGRMLASALVADDVEESHISVEIRPKFSDGLKNPVVARIKRWIVSKLHRTKKIAKGREDRVFNVLCHPYGGSASFEELSRQSVVEHIGSGVRRHDATTAAQKLGCNLFLELPPSRFWLSAGLAPGAPIDGNSSGTAVEFVSRSRFPVSDMCRIRTPVRQFCQAMKKTLP